MKNTKIIEAFKKRAILHINVSTFEQFKAGVIASKESKIPLIIGVSEGERNYWGINFIEDLVDEAKEKGINIFLNADHCKTIKSAKEAIDYKFDFVLFDGSDLNFIKNILRTKEVMKYRDKKSKNTLIEGELGYIIGHSDIKEIIELKKYHFTDPDLAEEFIKKTKIDLLAISIGNVHGIPNLIKFKNKIYKKAKLDFKRIKEIKSKVKIPLVLHGGSGLKKNDYLRAIENGISIIHINTEFRKMWKKEIEKEIKHKTVIPYKILNKIIDKLKRRIIYYQKLFWRK